MAILYAPVGAEESGAPFSVLSALTRLGADPSAEGALINVGHVSIEP